MANLTSTLDIRLIDDVSKTAAQIDASLRKMATDAQAMDRALAQGGASDKLAQGLRKLGASVPAIEGATRAMREYAAAERLAANRGDWTRKQAVGFQNMERVTLAGVRSIMSAERALEEQRARAFTRHREQMLVESQKRAHSGHFDQSTLGGTVATAGAFAFERMAEGVLERYKDFDKERRYSKVVMGLTDQQQEPLVQQALHGGATSRFNDISWLEAQREFASRGYNVDQVKAFTPIAADVGTAFDQTLPEAVKAIEGAMLGFGKDVSTFDKAVAAARKTADLEVKTSKISGMSFENITQLYKYGAAPAKNAGLSEEQMLAFGAVLKKQNMGGDEAGVAFRALAANLVKPTAGAVTALRANGIDFSSYQHAKAMDTEGFTAMVAQRYGVKLSAAAQAGVAKIFTDKSIIGDASKFTPAVVQFLRSTLGGNDAKSLKSIAGLAKEYRNASVDGVDTVRLLTDMMTAMAKNKGLANAIFGSKQGGRIAAALGDPEVFNGLLDQIRNHSAGFAGDVAAARNEGFNGQVAQLQGAIATLESSIGRAFDANGSGGLLTRAATAASEFTRAMSEMNPNALRATVEAAGAAAVVAGLKSVDFIKGGFGLKAAGAEMTSAGELQLQAGRLMLEAAGLHNVPHGAVPPGTGGGAKAGEIAAETPKGIYNGEGKPIPGEVPKAGILSGGGLKGVAGGLAEGVVGAILYQAGDDLQDYILGRFFGRTEAGKEKFKNFDPGKDLASMWMPYLDRMSGRVGDKGPADPYLSGDRAGIDERARRSADAFRRDPEAERGQRMMQMFAPLPEAQPYPDLEAQRGRAMMQLPAPVDTSGVDALKQKAGEAHAALDGLNTTVQPIVDNGGLQHTLSLLDQIQARLGSMSGTVNLAINQTGNAGGTIQAVSRHRSFGSASAGRLQSI